MEEQTIKHLLKIVYESTELSALEKLEILKFMNNILLNYEENIKALNGVLDKRKGK